MPAQINQTNIDALIDAAYDDLVAIRHDLHAHPQLAYEETYASALVQRELKAQGIDFVAGLATTGVVGWIDNGKAVGPAIALRADMDALPITEETGLPYTSQNPGLMHACGHDGHTTVLLGTARVLNKLRDQLPRPVKLIFQPAEEGEAGAQRMIDDGALTAAVGKHKVAAIFGLHGFPMLPVGAFTTRTGPLLASADRVSITITGTGGHAALPHTTTDPLYAATAIVQQLQAIVARNIDPIAPAVLSITTIHAGDAFNVIPEKATVTGTIRTIDKLTQTAIHSRIREVAEHLAAAHRCKAAVEIQIGYPVTMNEPAATQHSFDVARQLLGDGAVFELPTPIMGAEDFSFYGDHAKASFAFIGVKKPGEKAHPGLHTPRYDFTDEAIKVGVRLMCRWAMTGEHLT